jgi:hypothetical protein
MFDFGSILGSGTVYAQRHRPGNEYIFEQKPGWLTLITLGFYVRPWMTIDYPRVPTSVGRIESERFDPLAWKPEYPNTAFDNMRADDAFWAARIVSKFSDEAIRAVVEKARFSDSAATDYLTRTLIARRDKVVAAWINGVCPVVDAALSSDGMLTFANAAVDARAATTPERYDLQWFRFDNAADSRTTVGTVIAATSGSTRAPAELLATAGYVGVTITGRHPQHAGWAVPATFFFRRQPSSQSVPAGWNLVGIERGR